MSRKSGAITPPFAKGGQGGISTTVALTDAAQLPPNPFFAKGGTGALGEWHRVLLTRREFLLASAGGLAALFAPVSLAASPDPWPLLAALQDHLFPSEPYAPGAREIHALSYLQWIVADPQGDPTEQRFILKGADWLEDLSRQRHKASFIDLDPIRREQVLREVADTDKGDNWLSTVLLYLCEALLTDPVYGGNPDGIGWTWLQHQPGFPRPTKPSFSLGRGDGGEGSRAAAGTRFAQAARVSPDSGGQARATVAPSPPAPSPEGEGKKA